MPESIPGHNPVNDAIQVQVLDLDGSFVENISFRIARRMLNFGIADLVLQYPLTIKLLVKIESVDKQLMASYLKTYSEQMKFLQHRKSVLYGNYVFQAPDGTWMFTTNNQKVIWYLSRNAVEIISQEPPILRFRKDPNGLGHSKYKSEEEYYKNKKINRCVVCGETEKLNKHHVMPQVYRRHMPLDIKDHSYHDVLLLCLDCHEKYEVEAHKLKEKIAEEYGVVFHSPTHTYDYEEGQATKYARAIKKHKDVIPGSRQQEMKDFIAKIAGKSVTEEVIEEYANKHKFNHLPNESYVDYGKYVVENSDIQQFTERWREHFLETMQPKFMPELWDVRRSVYREV